MKKNIRIVLKPLVAMIFVLGFSSLFSSCMKHGMKTDMTDHGAGVVWMKHDVFAPGSITVPVNTTVTWSNKDIWAHTVTSDTGLFESKKIRKGDSFTYKFTVTGTYKYHCKIHDGMVGTIIVQ